MVTKQEKGLSGKVWNFVYSSENQLVSVDMTDQNGSSRVEYSYDALGRRTQKKVIRGADVQVNKYVYDSNEIIAELDEDNSVLATYTHSGLRTDDVLSVEVTSAGVARGLASAAGSYQYLKDGLGSIVDIADSGGSIIQHYMYSSFGKLLKIADALGNELISPLLRTSYTYTNREFDEETGLYYYRARYYDPGIGRFLTEDPHPGLLSSPISFNSKYIYANSNPINRIDPSGRMSFLKSLSIIIGASLAGAWAGGIAGGAVGGPWGVVVGVVVGAVVGAATAIAINGAWNVAENKKFFEGAGEAAMMGAIAGGIAGGLAAYNINNSSGCGRGTANAVPVMGISKVLRGGVGLTPFGALSIALGFRDINAGELQEIQRMRDEMYGTSSPPSASESIDPDKYQPQANGCTAQ